MSAHNALITPPYPHEPGCVACRETKKCNVCGGTVSGGKHCTNGRCLHCHASTCTGGGETSNGHGYSFTKGKCNEHKK